MNVKCMTEKCLNFVGFFLFVWFLFLFFLKIYLFIICKYTVAVFRHSRRGRQILLQMVVSHHVVAGI
jgi:glucan phosphoethanolaminetransferase (alkaline phosphatase superfamily)